MKISQKDLEGLKKKVALGNRIMFHQGLADYHGHVSARIPGTRNFFIKPVLAPLGSISVKDIIEVNIDEYKKTCEQNWAKAGNIYNQAAAFAPETPIFPSPRLIYTVQDGKEICQTLGDRMAMLLKGHGIVVCGDSLEYATVHAIYLERTAHMQWVASCVGKPEIMPQTEIDYMKENMTYRSYDAFAYFKSLLPRGGKL